MINQHVQKLLNIADAELGYIEKRTNSQLDSKTANAGSNNYTKYSRDLDAIKGFYNTVKNGYAAWCDIFVDWCYVQAFGVEKAKELLGQPMYSCGAGCGFSAGYFKGKGQFYTENPQPGDQIFFIRGGSICHTGIVYSVDKYNVYTIEGNTSSAPGVVANGGCVNKKSYPLGDACIYGYGRPDFIGVLGEEPVLSTPTDNTNYKVGDIVNFTGAMHYAGANAVNGLETEKSLAKITHISKNSIHPYHVRAVDENGNFVKGKVYGWVDAKDITDVAKPAPNTPTTPTEEAEKPAITPEAADPNEITIKLQILRNGDCDSNKGGNKGKQVTALQCLLKGLGYSVGITGADGRFGANTKNALTKFQNKNGLKASGEANAETWNALLGN